VPLSDILSTASSFGSIHKRQISSSDIDYYNKYVRASSADFVDIQIINNDRTKLYSAIQLQKHGGPICQVMFAHTKFGFIASRGSDCTLIKLYVAVMTKVSGRLFINMMDTIINHQQIL